MMDFNKYIVEKNSKMLCLFYGIIHHMNMIYDKLNGEKNQTISISHKVLPHSQVLHYVEKHYGQTLQCSHVWNEDNSSYPTGLKWGIKWANAPKAFSKCSEHSKIQ